MISLFRCRGSNPVLGSCYGLPLRPSHSRGVAGSKNFLNSYHHHHHIIHHYPKHDFESIRFAQPDEHFYALVLFNILYKQVNMRKIIILNDRSPLEGLNQSVTFGPTNCNSYREMTRCPGLNSSFAVAASPVSRGLPCG